MTFTQGPLDYGTVYYSIYKEKGRAARAGQGKTQEAATTQVIVCSYVLILSQT